MARAEECDENEGVSGIPLCTEVVATDWLCVVLVAKKDTKSGFLEWRRRVAQSRIVAIAGGRKRIEHRPTEQETKDSESRFDDLRHEI